MPFIRNKRILSEADRSPETKTRTAKTKKNLLIVLSSTDRSI
jgi:hypothetical protein